MTRFVIVCLWLFGSMSAGAEVVPEKPEMWVELGPGLEERVDVDGLLELRLTGRAGLQLALDGLRAHLAQLPEDARRKEAVARLEALLAMDRGGLPVAAKSGQAVCAPILRRIGLQYASFYSGSGCSGTEYEVDVFGTWDGNGCAVDIYEPGNLAQCGIQTSPSTVSSYKIDDGTPGGQCFECPTGSVLYRGECSSASDAMPVYRGLECCEDDECGTGEMCRYGQCMECQVDGDCPSGETCSAGSCVANIGPLCTPDFSCSGRSCTLDSDCSNNDCPQGSCSFGQCVCVW